MVPATPAFPSPSSVCYRGLIVGIICLFLGLTAVAQPDLDGPGTDGEYLEGDGGNASWITLDGDDYPDQSFDYGAINLIGGEGEDGGDVFDGGRGGNGGRLTLENLTGNPALDYGFQADTINLTGGEGGSGESAGLFDADGGRGGDGGHLYLDVGNFILGTVNLNGGEGGNGKATGEGGDGGSGGYVQLEGSLVGQGAGLTSTLNLLGGYAGSGSTDTSGNEPGSVGDSGVISVRAGAHWISSTATGIFNVELSSTPAGISNGFQIGRGDAGTFYMTGGQVDWLDGDIDISNESGNAGGLFEMTGGEFNLDGGSLHMGHWPEYGEPRINLLAGTFNFSSGIIDLGALELPGSPGGDGGLLNLDGGTLKTNQQLFDHYTGRFDFRSGTLHITKGSIFDSEATYGEDWLAAVEYRGGLFDNRTLIVDHNFAQYTDLTLNLSDTGELIVGGTYELHGGRFNMLGGRATFGRVDVTEHVGFTYAGGDLTLTQGTTDFRTLFDSAFDAPEGGTFTVRSGATFEVGAIDGEGNVAIESGGTIDLTGNAVLGFVADTTNTLTVTGAGSELIVGDDLFVGYSSGATTHATLSDGGEVVVNDLTTIGFNGGSTGTITVDNGRLETDDLRVSDVGSGELQITNGGEVYVDGIANVGWWTGSDGFVLLEDAGSELYVDSNFYLGRRGRGEIAINDGADAEVRLTTTLGSYTGSHGALFLDGSGSTFNTDSLVVSDVGFGYVLVSDGASFRVGEPNLIDDSGDIRIGLSADSDGLIEVQNAGSRLDADNDVFVGVSGEGELSVTDSGIVEIDGDLTLAVNAGSTGTVTIDSGGELYADSLNFGAGTSTLNFTNGILGLRDDQVLDNTLMSSLEINDLNSNQTLKFLGAVSVSSAVTFDAAGILQFGTLNLSNGSLGVEGEVIALGQTNVGASSRLDVQGGSFTASDTLNVGADSGTASQLNVSSGQLNFSDGLNLATDPGDAAEFTVSGGTVSGDTLTMGTGATFTQSGGTINLVVPGDPTENGGEVTINGGQVNLTGGTLALTVQPDSFYQNPPEGGRFEINGGNVELAGGTINLSGKDSFWGEAGEAGGLWLNGGTLTLSSGNIVMAPGPGFDGCLRPDYGNLTIDGGTLNIDPDTVTDMIEGGLDFRSGTLHMRTPYVVGSDTGVLADALGNDQLALGAGQTITTDDLFYVAASGGATATLSDGARLDVGSTALVGNTTGTSGTLTVQSGSSMTTADELIIGRNDGSPGITHVQGAGSQVTVGTKLVVSDVGDGTLNITSGGKVESGGDTNIGWWNESDGEMTVSGTNSELEVNGTLTVGARGVGLLTVDPGGKVETAGELIIGQNSGSTGVTHVQGTGSQVTVGTKLVVSDVGSGTLNITAGGTVASAGDTNIGWWDESDGAVTVADTNSELEVNGALTVGARGEGTLTIGTGGVVKSTGTVTIGDLSNSHGTLILEGGTLIAPSLTVGAGTASSDLRSGQIRLSGQQTLDAPMVNLLGLNQHTDDGVELVFLNDTKLSGSGADLILADGELNLTDHNLTVMDGATLGGIGVVNGSVIIENGSTLAPGSSLGTLTVDNLTLFDSSNLHFELSTPGIVGSDVNDLIEIEGNLTLDGMLYVTALAGFGEGTYHLLSYQDELLNNNGIEFAGMPEGFSYSLDATTFGQINLNVVLSTVPESSSIAIIFGAITFAFVTIRQRKNHEGQRTTDLRSR